MREFLIALLLAAMPAAGNFAGGLLAEWVRVSERMLSLALHAAAGIVVARSWPSSCCPSRSRQRRRG